MSGGWGLQLEAGVEGVERAGREVRADAMGSGWQGERGGQGGRAAGGRQAVELALRP